MTFRSFFEEMVQAIKDKERWPDEIIESYELSDISTDEDADMEEFFLWEFSMENYFITADFFFMDDDPRESKLVGINICIRSWVDPESEAYLGTIKASVDDLETLAVLGTDFVKEGQILLFEKSKEDGTESRRIPVQTDMYVLPPDNGIALAERMFQEV